MANCGIGAGISIVCDDLKRAGGNGKTAWAINLSDFRVPIDTSLSGFITSLELNTYVGIYKFEFGKYTIEASSTLQKGDAGIVSYLHQVIIRPISTTPTTDGVLEDLATSDTVWVIKTNNNEFKIYGGANGLTASAEEDATGRQQTDSPLVQLTLQGTERFKPKRLSRNSSGTDTAAVLAYLNAMSQ